MIETYSIGESPRISPTASPVSQNFHPVWPPSPDSLGDGMAAAAKASENEKERTAQTEESTHVEDVDDESKVLW